MKHIIYEMWERVKGYFIFIVINSFGRPHGDDFKSREGGFSVKWGGWHKKKAPWIRSNVPFFKYI